MTNTPLQDVQLFQTDTGIFDSWLHGAADTTVVFGPGDVRPTLASLIAELPSAGADVVVNTANENYAVLGTERSINVTAAGVTITASPAVLAAAAAGVIRVRNKQTAIGSVTISDGAHQVDQIRSAAVANEGGSLQVLGFLDISTQDGVHLTCEGTR